jgi:hypothetical protein
MIQENLQYWLTGMTRGDGITSVIFADFLAANSPSPINSAETVCIKENSNAS